MKFSLIRSTLGRKALMSVMGIALIGFLMVHLAGNLLLYVGKDTFNLYSHKLISNPFIYVLEALLLTGFGVHGYQGVRLTLLSRQARKHCYKKRKSLGRSNLFSSNMFLTGSVIFIFLVVHIKTFKYGEQILYSLNGEVIRDLYTVVVKNFQKAWYALLYVIAIGLLTCHLVHGSVSVPKTLGLHSVGISRGLRWVGIGLSVLIGLGFISMPLYFLFFGAKG